MLLGRRLLLLLLLLLGLTLVLSQVSRGRWP
jgi:hypothetical protein